MASPYIPTTEEDRQKMLAAIGVRSVEDLFIDIPAAYRDPPLILPPALSEAELLVHLRGLAGRNWTVDDHPSFLGGGASNHFVPSVVWALAGRGEFATSYTPYQPEVSQGVLQALYEFQSLIAQLTEMDAVNAGMYDGASALAEAALMACRLTRRKKVAVRETVSPTYRDVLKTYLSAQGIALVNEADAETACLVLQQPNSLGYWEEVGEAARVHERGGLLVVAVDPVSLGLFRPPGSYGADIVVGEGQPLGIHPSFGGPGLGLFACRKEYLRQMPGRIVGRTLDSRGREAFVLTLQTREQHIRRERATSNICTNETLAAVAAAVHLAALGKQGLRQVAELCYHKAHYAAAHIARLPGFSLPLQGVFFKEFVVRCPVHPAEVNQNLLAQEILGGVDVSDRVPNGLLLCVTEMNARDQIDRLVTALAAMAKR
ncbi:MAG: aminomethyl-transferring glycine dehydrogenase subunit GcvPA [Chloroflexi bacterium]|nr:aminomethyl-transferring glycine dehydrogenase subunit GcvPA [Chloroflexota bacterium]